MLPIIQFYPLAGIEFSWFQLQDSLPNCCDCRGCQPAVFVEFQQQNNEKKLGNQQLGKAQRHTQAATLASANMVRVAS